MSLQLHAALSVLLIAERSCRAQHVQLCCRSSELLLARGRSSALAAVAAVVADACLSPSLPLPRTLPSRVGAEFAATAELRCARGGLTVSGYQPSGPSNPAFHTPLLCRPWIFESSSSIAGLRATARLSSRATHRPKTRLQRPARCVSVYAAVTWGDSSCRP